MNADEYFEHRIKEVLENSEMVDFETLMILLPNNKLNNEFYQSANLTRTEKYGPLAFVYNDEYEEVQYIDIFDGGSEYYAPWSYNFMEEFTKSLLCGFKIISITPIAHNYICHQILKGNLGFENGLNLYFDYCSKNITLEELQSCVPDLDICKLYPDLSINNYKKSPFVEPLNSPWGKNDDVLNLMPGIYSVSTSSHGGIMISKELVNLYLSEDAQKYGIDEYQCLSFEEDCAIYIVWRELMDKGFTPFIDERDSMANETIKEYYPNYWKKLNQSNKHKRLEKEMDR